MKMAHFRLLALLGLLIPVGTGCRSLERVDLRRQTGGSAFLFRQFQAYDGRTGRPLDFYEVARRCGRAEVVLFGEEHNNAVCNQLEAQLLHALLRAGRPWALAMEFFEADTQDALNAYDRGRLDEPAFLKITKRRADYLDSHRSLIELCRATHTPVIAANAPRGLVRAYRKSGQSYEDFRAGLPPEDQRWLPVTNSELEDDYRDRFAALMSGHGEAMRPATQPESRPTSGPESAPTSQSESPPAPELPTFLPPPAESQPAAQMASSPAEMPTSQATSQPVTQPAEMPTEMASMPAMPSWQELFKAQLLWDQSMSEAVAHSREREPRRGVLLIVGGFHVAHAGGTFLKFKQQRPEDRVVTIAYRGQPEVEFTFEEEDRGAGDIVIYGLTPPEEEAPPAMPAQPASAAGVATPPASMPGVMPTGMPGDLPGMMPTTTPSNEFSPNLEQDTQTAPSPTPPTPTPTSTPAIETETQPAVG